MGILARADLISVAHNGQASNMSDTLRHRVRVKLLRQLAEDGVPDSEHDDPRRIAIETDLDTLASVAEDDPLIEELAARYLVF